MIQTITGFLPLIVLFVGFRILLKILEKHFGWEVNGEDDLPNLTCDDDDRSGKMGRDGEYGTDSCDLRVW
jgi:hypothetical protein